jgi:hypothetical protein
VKLFALFCLLVSIPVFAQQSAVIIPEISSASNISPGNHHQIAELRFPSNHSEWNPILQTARAMAAQGYQLLLRFDVSDSDWPAISHAIPQSLLSLGKSVNGCMFATAQPNSLSTMFGNAPQFSFQIKSAAIACREVNPDARIYLTILNRDTLQQFLQIAEENSLFAYIDGYVTQPADFVEFRKIVLEKQPGASLFSLEPSASGGAQFLANAFHAFHDHRYSLIIPVDPDGLKAATELQNSMPSTASPVQQSETSVVDSNGAAI